MLYPIPNRTTEYRLDTFIPAWKGEKMTHIIDGRPEHTVRGHTKQREAPWVTVEDLGKSLGNRTGNAIREALTEMGYGCRIAKKPKPEAVKKGLVREYHKNGKKFYKWKRKEILPLLKEFYAEHSNEAPSEPQLA